MQELWLQGLEWNDPLEEDLRYKFMASCNKLEGIRIRKSQDVCR